MSAARTMAACLASVDAECADLVRDCEAALAKMDAIIARSEASLARMEAENKAGWDAWEAVMGSRPDSTR